MASDSLYFVLIAKGLLSFLEFDKASSRCKPDKALAEEARLETLAIGDGGGDRVLQKRLRIRPVGGRADDAEARRQRDLAARDRFLALVRE